MKTPSDFFFQLLAEVPFTLITLQKIVNMNEEGALIMLSCHLLFHTDRTPDYAKAPPRIFKKKKEKKKLC